MNKHQIEERIIVEKPTTRSGVYAIINPVKKKVYVGETMNLFSRTADHLRSIFGYENSSNVNLVNENCKTFWMFVVQWDKYDKKKSDRVESKSWILDETIYMYLFRKYGFTLYNGDANLKDNFGYKRDFLLMENITEENLEKKKQEFFEGENPLYYGFTKWDDFFEAADRELNLDIEKRFGLTLENLTNLDENGRIEVWNDTLKKLLEKDEKAFYNISLKTIKKKDVFRICNELSTVKLTKSDMKKCGLKEKSIRKLAEEGCLDKIVVSKFGLYLEQNPMTILSTKVYDIEHNKKIGDGLHIVRKKDDEENEQGICFWALKRLPLEHTLAFLSDFGNYKGPRYAILPYTTSNKLSSDKRSSLTERMHYQNVLNPQDGESQEMFFDRMRELVRVESEIAREKFVYGYAGNRKKIDNVRGREIYPYPEGMFPEVVLKTSHSVALLISELNFAEESFEREEFYQYFYSHPQNAINELSVSLKSQNSHVCASMKDKERFIKEFECQCGEQTEVTGCLIAKLEYPYIVALAD